MNQYNLLT